MYKCLFICRSSPCADGIRKRLTISISVFVHISFTQVVPSHSGAHRKKGQNFTHPSLEEICGIC